MHRRLPPAYRRLGYRSYDEYLRSPRWQRIKKIVFAHKGTDCRICKMTAECIHHTNYRIDTMAGPSGRNSRKNKHRMKGLIPLCQPCHHRIEFDENGRKRSLKEANAAMWELMGRQRKNPADIPRWEELDILTFRAAPVPPVGYGEQGRLAS